MPNNETISGYQLLERHGRGPLGENHRARDTRRGRTVMLTIVDEMLVADPAKKSQLLEAAREASELSHSHIAGFW